MTKSATVHARIEPELKEQGEAVLQQLGLSPSDLVTLTYRQLVLRQGLPFEVRIPNAETIAALEEDVSKHKRYASIREALDDMWEE